MKEQSVLAYCEVGWTVFSSDNSTGVEFSKYSPGSRIELQLQHTPHLLLWPIASLKARLQPFTVLFSFSVVFVCFISLVCRCFPPYFCRQRNNASNTWYVLLCRAFLFCLLVCFSLSYNSICSMYLSAFLCKVLQPCTILITTISNITVCML